jgi:Histidine kinase-, DNA gyrase B-, and HSP90-like ATPase
VFIYNYNIDDFAWFGFGGSCFRFAPVYSGPKGPENLAQGLPWETCFIASWPVGEPESRSAMSRDFPPPIQGGCRLGIVLITVTDSGIGLKAEDLPRLFETFHTTKADGMGMGLAISRSIVKRTAGDCGQHRMPISAQPSSSRCRCRPDEHYPCYFGDRTLV